MERAVPLDPRLLLTTLDEVAGAVPADIAGRTGVAEADVRRSLESLEAEGLVVRRGEGWSLPPRSSGELRELHVVAVLLEGMALRSCPPFGPHELAALHAANAQLRAARDASSAKTADDAFHRALVDSCANPALQRLHADAKAALTRYEMDFWNLPGYIERSATQHDGIVRALEAHDTELATALIRENFESALPELTEGDATD